MQQRAARAPNVGELAAPQVTGLDNALTDPCSVSNTNITPELHDLCVSTGMTDLQVGDVEDIVAGQINGFFGTDLDNLPAPESADTLTAGVVWTPQFESLKSAYFSVDYYDITINNYIDEFGAQEVLDQCYEQANATECAKIHRVGGTLTVDGSGVELFTTNLKYLQAEGIEVQANFGFDMGGAGSLTFNAYINKYLTQESQSSDVSEVIDCKGRYGTQCGNPLPSVRWLQTTTWAKGPFDVSLSWNHLGSTSIEPTQSADNDGDGESDVFEPFQTIGSYDYFDLSGSWSVGEWMTVRAYIANITDEEPPVVGNEAGDTRSNSGNTFPSVFTALGRTYSLGVSFRF
jgi:outer membrane receptor protein involved in Fe transport